MNKLRIFSLLCFALLSADAFAILNEVRFRLYPVEDELAAGEEFVAVVHAQIGEGWHLYSMTKYPPGALAPQPTTIGLGDTDVVTLTGPVRQPSPHVAYDSNFEIDTEYFEGRVDFELPLKVVEGVPAGEHEVPVRIRFMACNDRVCLPPQIVNLSLTLRTVAGASEPAGQTASAELTASPEGEGGSEEGLVVAKPDSVAGDEAPESDKPAAVESRIPTGTLAYLWFAMAMGALALLTPCVFPMIPITVSYFTKREVSRRQALADALLYSFGIIFTFTAIGFLLTFLFGAGGLNRVATSPVVNVLIATIFVVFALSLFGVFEIRVPSSWLSAVDKKSSSVGGPVGILLMALTFSLTSFTCTVPFVGTVMVAATQGDWLWSLLGITAFATVFSAPFFLLALFPSWLKSLPKSGSWMDSIKITMGFLELAAAMKFISNVDLVYQWELVTRPVFIAVWLALALITALYLLGRFYFPHEAPVTTVSAGRVLTATLFLAISLYLFRGLFGFPLGELDAFLPPRDYGGVGTLFSLTGESPKQEEHWYTDYQEALSVARAENRTVFVDFTGYTCTNCRWMEANMFVRDEVRQLFRQMVLVRLYTDGGLPEHEENLNMERDRFGTIALPYYVLVTPEDEVIDVFPGLTRDEAEFVGFLRKGLRQEPSRVDGD